MVGGTSMCFLNRALAARAAGAIIVNMGLIPGAARSALVKVERCRCRTSSPTARCIVAPGLATASAIRAARLPARQEPAPSGVVAGQTGHSSEGLNVSQMGRTTAGVPGPCRSSRTRSDTPHPPVGDDGFRERHRVNHPSARATPSVTATMRTIPLTVPRQKVDTSLSVSPF